MVVEDHFLTGIFEIYLDITEQFLSNQQNLGWRRWMHHSEAVGDESLNVITIRRGNKFVVGEWVCR